MYEELVKRLHQRIALSPAGSPLQDDVKEAADAIEELTAIAESYKRSMEAWADEAARAQEQWIEQERKALIKSLPKWIPVTARPMDEEERKEWSEKLGYDIEYNEALIYTSQLPDDGQEVLTFSKYGGIRIDKFGDDPDYGCFFEENGDMDGIVAWMPLPTAPEPPKEES